MADVSYYEQAAASPYAVAFLDAIAWAEGADYNTLVGGRSFSDFSWHPGLYNAALNSTAAGRYQFLVSTWNDAANALGLPDFSPHSQDLAALYLIDRRGGLDAVLSGDFDSAIHAVRKEWASLPGAGYGQGERSLDDLRSVFQSALGGAATTTITTIYDDGGGESLAPSNTFFIGMLVALGLGAALWFEHGR